MNRRKVIGVIGALLLAAVGTVLLIAYVNNAEERALEGQELVEVYKVTDTIGAGTDAVDIEGSVEVEQVPRNVRAEDAIVELAEIEGLVAEIELVPGEQLILSRWVDPITFQREVGRVTEIPAGMQEVTVSLAPERAAGGSLLPGDTVGVYASFEPFTISSEVPVELDDGTIVPPNGQTPNTTNLILHKVLVTNVQLEELPEVEEREAVGEEEPQDVRLAPTGNLLVSLAVDTFDGERLVFTSEFGFVWLALEPDAAIETPSLIQTRATVYRALDQIVQFLNENEGEGDGDG